MTLHQFKQDSMSILQKWQELQDRRFLCYFCKVIVDTLEEIDNHKHIEPKQEVKIDNCDECSYIAPNKQSLIRHKDIIHEGVRYGCDNCSYQGSTKDNLKLHKQSKHDGIMYTCDNCSYKASYKSNVEKHNK